MQKIITVGFEIPSYSKKYVHFNSDQSLLDADIIIFEPNFSDYSVDEKQPTYQGKRFYRLEESSRLKEDTMHWHQELRTALKSGKNIFVFFNKYEEIVITESERPEGVGKNRTTNINVSIYDNYQFLPIVGLPKIISKSGKEIKPIGNPLFSLFWSELKTYLKYESYIDGKIDEPLFVTATGQKPIGGIFKIGSGHLVLLPPIRYDNEKFTRYDEKKDEEYWTKDAIKFGKRLIQILIDIDKNLQGEAEKTPPPKWIEEREYKLESENKIENEIEKITCQMKELTDKKILLTGELEKEGLLKNLLYEKGKPLENAILEALRILEYKAENYNDGNLELDQIIISLEGERFIGEAEGKDDSAINIDKLRQLMSNIQEDLEKQDVKEPAVGILFANGFRLTEPEKRAEQFTEKCIKTAKISNYILIRTVDLFNIVKYVKMFNDVDFAKQCRDVISSSKGKIVCFPDIPNK